MATSAEILEREKRKRTVLRMSTTKLLTRLDKELQKPEVDSLLLEETIAQLRDKEETLNALDTVIENMSEDLDALEAELTTREEYKEKIIACKTRASRRLKSEDDRSSQNGGSAASGGCPEAAAPQQDRQVTVKLPRLVLERFNGNASEWQSFWAQYESAIHNNTGLNDVDKFNYLRSYLEGPAASAISGLPLTQANYKKAVDILVERFGRRDVVITAHMNKLLSLNPVKRTSELSALRQLYDNCEIQIRSLETMGMPPDSYGSLLCPLLFKMLPDGLVLEFNRQNDETDNMKVTSLLTFIRKEIESRERTYMVPRKEEMNLNARYQPVAAGETKTKYNKNGVKPKIQNFSAAALSTVVEGECVFCEEAGHATDECTAFTIQRKRELLRSRGRCYVCFKKNHLARNCKSNISCLICKKRHRKSLCQQLYPEDPQVIATTVASVIPSQQYVERRRNSMVMLQTIKAAAVGPKSQIRVRCLLDGGSQRTFIRQELSRSLQLRVVGEEVLSLHTFGSSTPLSVKQKRVIIRLQDLAEKEKFIDIEALETPEICTAFVQVPSQEIQQQADKQCFRLSDCAQDDTSACEISLLIGSDCYWRIVSGKMRRLSSSLVAMETLFGWAVQGPLSSEAIITDDKSACVMKLVVSSADQEDDLTPFQLERFWKLDSIGINEPAVRSISDEEAERQFNETVTCKEGRYEVFLPWKTDETGFPDNRRVAEKRLGNLVRKFQRNLPLYAEYKAIIEDHIRKGIVEEVSGEDLDSERTRAIFYLPHQAVVKRDKLTTKVRVVFDASAHMPGEPSLNNLLHPGPNMNPSLLTLLVRFRKNEIAFTADIEKAFLQVGISPQDRDAVRFLWVDGLPRSPDGHFEVKVLRMTRVLFGVTSSPFLLAAVVKHHISKYRKLYPDAYQVLDESLYVDDLIDGKETVNQAFKVTSEAKLILEEAGMSLRKWQTNSAALQSKWDEVGFDRIIDTEPIGDQPCFVKVLGLIWDPQRDLFKFDVTNLLEFIASKENTKRSILQSAGRIFDPIGFLSPVVIRVKILFQELWERGISWDEELPKDIQHVWQEWCQELPAISEILIPRYYYRTSGEEKVVDVQLHCFTDASELAYGAALYVRYTTSLGSVGVCLVSSKTRVAPLKKLSIPRLELMGALIGSRLVTHIQHAFHPITDCDITFWTDSMIALCWIRSSSKEWKPFVGNRVREIQSLSKPERWRHCPGLENPADLLTRGQSMRELKVNSVWWTGPCWLKGHMEDWPKTSPDQVYQRAAENERTVSGNEVSLFATTAEPVTECGHLLELTKYSNASKILRITSWVIRFTNNARKARPNRKGALTTEELLAAELYWTKVTQKDCFPDELKALGAKRELGNESRIKTLSPFLDENGVIRVGGRLQFSELDHERKHPVLLSGANEWSKLQVKESHDRVMHSGVTETLAQLRSRYYILKARQLARTLIQRCVICKRFNAKPYAEVMAPLPKDRCQAAPPFETTGVDFAGPIYTKTQGKAEKSYLALFTCAVTRAVHLEVVSDLTTQNFILAFKRFIARRGICKIIYSDNARTFKKACKDLNAMWRHIKNPELKEFLGSQRITWRFIVERAAWWGGFWERMVRSVKTCLRKILGRALLNYEELSTVLAQVEAIINSRPLTHMYNDAREPEPLTPSHFLVGRRLTSLPEQDTGISEGQMSSSKQQLKKRMDYQRTLVDRFWTRWREQYLADLRSAHHRKPSNRSDRVKAGDVVLISEARIPRPLWKMGQIEEVFHGRDGKVRSCAVRLTNRTTLKRPVQLLYPLEVSSQVTSEDKEKSSK